MRFRKLAAGLIGWAVFLAGLATIRGEALAVPAAWQGGEGTPTIPQAYEGAVAVVKSDDQEEINVRAGPGTDYPMVGKLFARDQVPALGRSPGGDWVLIAFPSVPGSTAWVYAYLVDVNGMLPVVEPPPTPTPLVTPTIDPTLAAQFLLEVPPTRLPTFTAPPPLTIPTFETRAAAPEKGNMAVAYLMIGLVVAGVFGIFLSFLRIR